MATAGVDRKVCKQPETITNLGKKILVPTKTGNSVIDVPAKENYLDLVRLLLAVEREPSWAKHAVTFLNDMHDKEQAEKNEEVTDAGGLGKLDNDWIVAYVSRKLSVTATACGKADRKNPGIVRKIFLGILNSGPGTQLPSTCCDGEILTRTCDEVCSKMGDRHITYNAPEKLISEDGNVRLKQMAYVVKLNTEGNVTRITHRATGDVADLTTAQDLDKTYELQDNFSDMLGRLFKDEHHKHFVHTFYKKGFGPHKFPMLRGQAEKLKTIAKTIAAAVVLERSASKAGKEQSSSSNATKTDYKTEVKAKTVEQTEDAREKLAERRAKKRRLSATALGSSPSRAPAGAALGVPGMAGAAGGSPE
jgi:hypothetical protein